MICMQGVMTLNERHVLPTLGAVGGCAALEETRSLNVCFRELQ